MSKYTRSNKINHYHDSNNMRVAPKQKRAANRVILIDRNICEDGLSKSSVVSKLFHLHLHSHLHLRLDSDESNDAESDQPTSKWRKRKNDDHNISTRYDSSTLKQLAFFTFFILAAMIVCSQVTGVSSLNCYHCSSVDNPGCDESFSGRANITDTDCARQLGPGKEAVVCRKIVQYIEDKKVVIRSCGYIDEHEGKDHKSMCYKRSGTFAIMMESCNCYTENCNHSASLVPSRALILGLISASSFGLLAGAMAFNIRAASC